MSRSSAPLLGRLPLAAGTAAALLGLQSFAPVDGGLTVTTPTDPVAPGTAGDICVDGNDGDWALIMIDSQLGGSTLPYLGGIDIDLGQGPLFNTLFRPLVGGSAKVSCLLDCDNQLLLGVQFYVQAVSLNLTTRDVCVSNVSPLSWDDDCQVGCTPGYWRQPHHADSWPAPYTPTTPFSDVFEDAFPGMTLDQVLGEGGGDLDALGRHTVAALLNATSPDVDFELTTQEVIDAFNAVFPAATTRRSRTSSRATTTTTVP